MIFLILLLAVCDAVHMNSNYFQSESVIPSDCTIQPTQQECMEYAQLTMTPEIALVEVTSGEPATLYMEVSSGSPAVPGSPEYMSEDECQAYGDSIGTSMGNGGSAYPTGCFKIGVFLYWVPTGTGLCNEGGGTCIQKSPTAAAYVTESECAALSPYGGAWFAASGTFPIGCIKTNNYYWNPDVAGDAGTACGTSSWNCVQKHSYYNFGHVEVSAGLPALEGDIRYVSEKECQAYAVSVGLSFGVGEWPTQAPTGCWLHGSNVRYNTYSNNKACGVDYSGDPVICIQRDVITHHAAAEGCLSDGKVRWNIPFIEVSSGLPATVGPSEGSPDLSMSISDCEAFAASIKATFGVGEWETQAPTGCWLHGSNVRYNTYSNDKACGVDYGDDPVICIQKSSTYRAYVSEAECKNYATSLGGTFIPSSWSQYPSGCIKSGDLNAYIFNTNVNSLQCGIVADANARICIQKPVTELPCAPHQCVCKRGNVVSKTYQAGVRSDRFVEYVEVSSGSPDMSLSEAECKSYTQDLGATWGGDGYSTSSYPSGCLTAAGHNVYMYNNYQHGSTTSHPCGLVDAGIARNCIQKITKTYKFIEVTTGAPATWTAVEVSSGSPDLSVSLEECQEYATSLDGISFGDTFDNPNWPRGCIYVSSTEIKFNTNTASFVECGGGQYNAICIQKSPTLDAYVSESECEQYAVNTDGVNWGGQTDLTSRPFGCYLRLGDTYYNKNSLSTTPCSSSEICIQKAPFHAKSVQSIVKQAIDAILDAEMHYAESVNVFIEDFDHPKTTASDTLYTKQASYAVTDYDFTYSTITANEEWRPAIPFNTLEEAKASCSADSSNCLGVTHRHLGGVDLYLRHNGNSDLQLASYDQEHDERLYFQLLDRPFFIRFPILASTVGNDLKALCDSYPSCFARGNYVNAHDAEWDSSNYPGDANGNYIAVFYKQFQLQQATKVNAVYRSLGYVQVTTGTYDYDTRVDLAMCQKLAANEGATVGTVSFSDIPYGCMKCSHSQCKSAAGGNQWAFNTYTGAKSNGCDSKTWYGGGCVYLKSNQYTEVTSGAPDGSVSESECEQYQIDKGYSHFFTQNSASRPKGCWLYNNDQVYYNLHATGGGSCSGSGQLCIQKLHPYVSVDTLYEAFQGCEASPTCEGITGYQEVTIGAAATQTVLFDQDLLINDGDDFQLIVYDFQTDDCAGSGGSYTSTTYADKGNFHVLEACHHGGFTENTASFFGKRVLKKTAVATETCSEDCASLGYTVSQMTDSGIRYIQVYHGILGDTYVSTHNGAPDLSISTADACEAAANAHSTYTWGGSNSWSNRPTGCHIYYDATPNSWSRRPTIYWNTQTVNTPGCLYYINSNTRHGGCFQQYPMEIDAEKKVDESECEAYAASVNKPYSDAISSQASSQHENYIPGCQADSTNVYWNPSTTATKVCGHDGNACIQKVHDANCLCTQKVATSGHNIKTDCFTGFEFKDEVVQVSSGSPALEGASYVSEEECHAYAVDHNYHWSPGYTNTVNPSGCFLIYSYSGDTVYFGTYSISEGSECGNEHGAICIQKRKACQPCPAGTTININANGNVADLIEVSSGAPDMSVSESECVAIAGGETNPNWIGQTSAASFPAGCIKLSDGRYYFGLDTCVGDCGDYSIACIQKVKACTLCPAGSDSVPYSSECFTCPDGESSIPGGRCTNCAAGQFQAGGSGCTDCNTGTYQNEDGAAVCKSCPIGSSSNAGSDALTDCNLCTAAYYLVGDTCTICPGGKTSQALASSCTDCGAGTYGQSGVCSSCQAGRYQNEHGKSSCKLCPQGSYLTTTGADASDDCTSCTAGKYNGATGSTSNVCENCIAGQISAARAATCTNCAAGQFQASSGQSSCGSCTGGKYQNQAGQTSCKLCGAGTYHNNNGQTAVSACTNCAAGRYSSAGATSCTNCAAGTYSSAGASSCTNCAAGTYSSAGAETCLHCNGGQYSGEGSSSCTNCVAGKHTGSLKASGLPNFEFSESDCSDYASSNGYTYLSSSTIANFVDVPQSHHSCAYYATHDECGYGQLSWDDCKKSCVAIGSPEGCVQRASEVWYNTHASQRHCGVFSLIEPRIYCVQETSFLECVDCVAGQYSAAAATTCINCAAGQSSSAGASSCTNCAAGKYSAAAGGLCFNCAIGNYQSQAGQTDCIQCPAGQYQNSAGGASCNNCATGKFQNEIGKGTCKDCAAGQFQDDNGATSCKDCPSGDYQSQTGKTSCIECPAGQYQSSAGAASCNNCAAGTYSSAGTTSCTDCAVGKYSNAGAGACTLCPVGKYGSEEGLSQCETVSRCYTEDDCIDSFDDIGCRKQVIIWAYTHKPRAYVGSQIEKFGSQIFSTQPVAGRAWTWTDANDCFKLCMGNSACNSFQLCSPNSCCLYSGGYGSTWNSGGHEIYYMDC